jgi:hypothetical protein
MRPAHCVECARLWYDTAALLQKYNAAKDAAASTPGLDHASADRQTDLAEASTLLLEAQRLEHAHQDSHHSFALLSSRRPEDRRVSDQTGRRRTPRGGRRWTDYGWSALPPLAACAECQTGTAERLAPSTEGARSKVTYRCRDCGHTFDRLAE